MPSKKSSKSRKSAAKRGPAGSKKKSAPKRPVATKAAKKAGPKKVSARKIVAKKGVAKKRPIAAAPARKTAPAKKPAKALAKKAPVRARAAAPKKGPAAPVASSLVQRRENGHIDKQYAKDLLSRSGPREDEGPAFLGGPRTDDDLAEGLGEEFVETATSGEDESEDVANQVVSEERGGPFVVTTAGTEFADGVDESNPKGAKREPFPTT